MLLDEIEKAPKVIVREECGEWHIFVKTAGGVEETKSFRGERYAMSFAEGQRIRLGLVDIEIQASNRQIKSL